MRVLAKSKPLLKTAPKMPPTMPTMTGAQIMPTGSISFMGKEKAGSMPRMRKLIQLATTEATMQGTTKKWEKLLCSSSKAKRAPAKGALKAAARPAEAPAVMK